MNKKMYKIGSIIIIIALIIAVVFSLWLDGNTRGYKEGWQLGLSISDGWKDSAVKWRELSDKQQQIINNQEDTIKKYGELIERYYTARRVDRKGKYIEELEQKALQMLNLKDL